VPILLQKSFCTRDQNSFGCTRDFRVKMWGTSSPEDKLAGDLGNVIEATSTGGRRSDFFTAEKLAAGNLGLLQQYRHEREMPMFISNAEGHADIKNAVRLTRLRSWHRCRGYTLQRCQTDGSSRGVSAGREFLNRFGGQRLAANS
jgi:hypothetical protein